MSQGSHIGGSDVMDLDVIAEVDPLTGQSRVEDRPRALRWLESLHCGPDNNNEGKTPLPLHYYDNDQLN